MRHQTVGASMDNMKTLGAANRHKARDRIASAKLLDVPLKRQIGQPVGIVGEKDLLVLEVLAHAKQPLADIAVQAGVHEGDAPVVQIAPVQLDPAAAVAQSEVVRHGLRVIEKILT